MTPAQKIEYILFVLVNLSTAIALPTAQHNKSHSTTENRPENDLFKAGTDLVKIIITITVIVIAIALLVWITWYTHNLPSKVSAKLDEREDPSSH
jgi:flagellar biosynthesis protein FliP